jgi:hypothetical protein
MALMLRRVLVGEGRQALSRCDLKNVREDNKHLTMQAELMIQ